MFLFGIFSLISAIFEELWTERERERERKRGNECLSFNGFFSFKF
jgi:hypothetical protein